MKLQKAVAWYYNDSKKDQIIGDLHISVPRQRVVNLFKANPNLSYEAFARSRDSGSLFAKRTWLIEVNDPRDIQIEPLTAPLTVSDQPRTSTTKSSLTLGKDDKDWIDDLENDFAGQPPTSQEEAWKIEREKMMRDLDQAETGDEGEVFADNDFDFSSDTDFGTDIQREKLLKEIDRGFSLSI